MTKPKKYDEKMVVLLPKGSFGRIDKIIGAEESRSSIIRDGLERELRLREARLLRRRLKKKGGIYAN